MAIYGTATYLPSGRWAFPRPYIVQVTFGFGAGAIITHSDNEFFITDGTHPTTHVVCNFIPGLFASNSNRYTLDRCIVDWYALEDPSPTPIPVPFFLQYSIDPVTIEPELFLSLSGWTDRYTVPLPAPPADYWSPSR